MLFSLDVLRARKGDCMILHYGTKANPRLAVIDGGPSKVYQPHLRPRLEAIHKARKLGRQQPLPVDVLMISHVDEDHVKGIIELTDELRAARADKTPQLVRVFNFWHNTFDDLLDTTPGELRTVAASFGLAALGGHIDLGGDHDAMDGAMVLASIPQGRDLRLAAELFDWDINRQFGGKLILAAKTAKPVTVGGKVTMTVAGPMKPELVKLQKAHDAWVKKNKEKIAKETAAVPAAYTDKSVPNLSSLVVLAEAGGKRILCTGDARGDKILEGLQLAGLLGAANTSKMHVDLLKVPHHGSSRNVKKSFFARVTADHYVFSGNGQHGNPERATLEMLFAARPNADFTLYLTYPVDEIDEEREKDWIKEQKSEKKRRAEKKTAAAKAQVKVRTNWSHAKHSLAGFFAANPLKAGQKIAIVPAKKGHVIDLGSDKLADAWPELG